MFTVIDKFCLNLNDKSTDLDLSLLQHAGLHKRDSSSAVWDRTECTSKESSASVLGKSYTTLAEVYLYTLIKKSPLCRP